MIVLAREGSRSVFAAVWELTWLQLCVSCLRSLFISPSLFSSRQHRHDSSSAFGMQIDHLGINTGDWLLFATKLPSASLVNADGNLSLLQFQIFLVPWNQSGVLKAEF